MQLEIWTTTVSLRCTQDSYLGEKLRVVVRDVVQYCISKGALELGLAVGWAAAEGGEQVQTGSDGGLHQGKERKALDENNENVVF